MGQKVELRPLELWIIQLLRVATGWVSVDKIMAVFFTLRLNYPLPGVSFVQRGKMFWSPEIEETLKRLVAQGLVEESSGVFRLSRRGNKLAEKVLPNNNWLLPYADLVFYLAWDVKQLAEYVSNHYPSNLQSVMERKG